ncbi:8f0d22ac-448d-4962-ae3a-7cf1e62ee916-CDS [Sclerotinia trifoliorum]|uniref:8f0d22ac-448d-4962-ae3a-7cf1e62ee916-CDS n=1 Tax=Sclerotinia trifoliorum TaxID=28548 RepID=A0A8H2ZPR5_9HELO|nr:8f0d22ac-448d-4962-ae3a-7cf1e62ee916-CDS [Sclerotinia trifoliorum]
MFDGSMLQIEILTHPQVFTSVSVRAGTGADITDIAENSTTTYAICAISYLWSLAIAIWTLLSMQSCMVTVIV